MHGSKEAVMRKGTFYGWRVVSAAFVLAMLGLGFGFYGPPEFLHAVRESRGWSLALVSTAVTVHFLVGAIVTASLPALYGRFGISAVTKVGALSPAVGVFGWAMAAAPWQLFAATLFSGAGWVTMGVAAVNFLFGLGFGNGTFLPPLIAQAEFAREDVSRWSRSSLPWRRASTRSLRRVSVSSGSSRPGT
jgi:hypothetical protein